MYDEQLGVCHSCKHRGDRIPCGAAEGEVCCRVKHDPQSYLTSCNQYEAKAPKPTPPKEG